MSRFTHRQEPSAWTWSVVLLSTLLLSPVASASLRHALLEALPVAQSGSAPLAPPDAAHLTPPQSRRLEEEALRAAKSGKAFVLRLDTAHDDVPALFLVRSVTPSPPVVATGRATPILCAVSLPRSASLRAAPPRAPPV